MTKAALFDVEKTLDQVFQEGLVVRLNDLGLDLSLIRWIKSFLFDRWLIIKISSTLSEP